MTATTTKPETTLDVTMTLDKETKGAVRYADNSADSVLPTVYLRKEAFDGGVFPQEITVSITAA